MRERGRERKGGGGGLKQREGWRQKDGWRWREGNREGGARLRWRVERGGGVGVEEDLMMLIERLCG